MKQRILVGALFAILAIASEAQLSPQSHNATHSDSCWHFTLGYDTPRLPSDDGMIVVTHICTPDTCVSSSTRYIQGKRYKKKYMRQYGEEPELLKRGKHSCTLSVPEEAISDTVYAVTYCEYTGRNGTEYMCDTVAIGLPGCPPMSCHRVKDAVSTADRMSEEYPYINNIRYYTPLTGSNAAAMAVTPNVVRYVTNSDKLNPEYLDNAQNIEDLMSIIDDVLADSSTRIEAVQIVGYTSPDGSENNSTQLGRARAIAMREHVRRHHNLPDSIFEVADGGINWNMIYADIEEIDVNDGDELIGELKNEPDVRKREAMLKRFDNGKLYTTLLGRYFPAHRIACCTGIYYSNGIDSTAMALNEIIDELVNNPSPDYRRLIDELKQYKDDPRVLNLQGVIEYRRHHRHAAERAFAKAAMMGDEQAATNLEIVEANKEKRILP